MKKEFAVLKSPPRIDLAVTRDSVAAGDDADAPHKAVITLPSFLDPSDFLREVLVRYSLPTISGGSATWTCHMNGKQVAVVAQQWPRPKVTVDEVNFLESNELHFKYHAQEEPEQYV